MRRHSGPRSSDGARAGGGPPGDPARRDSPRRPDILPSVGICETRRLQGKRRFSGQEGTGRPVLRRVSAEQETPASRERLRTRPGISQPQAAAAPSHGPGNSRPCKHERWMSDCFACRDPVPPIDRRDALLQSEGPSASVRLVRAPGPHRRVGCGTHGTSKIVATGFPMWQHGHNQNAANGLSRRRKTSKQARSLLPHFSR